MTAADIDMQSETIPPRGIFWLSGGVSRRFVGRACSRSGNKGKVTFTNLHSFFFRDILRLDLQYNMIYRNT